VAEVRACRPRDYLSRTAARVAEYRRASRVIVRTEYATLQRRCLGLLELVDMARSEADPIITRWYELAIWAESKGFLGLDDKGFLGLDDEEPALPPEPYEHRQRRLRAEGFETCPR
jgi:hypothetical protein